MSLRIERQVPRPQRNLEYIENAANQRNPQQILDIQFNSSGNPMLTSMKSPGQNSLM